MFKTARFKIHNPSRHKKTMLWYAMTQYHNTLKRVLETALADPDLLGKISVPDKKGKLRVNKFETARVVRPIAPKEWALAPVRDYLIKDAAAMLLSHFKKVEKGKHKSNPPTQPSLSPISDLELDLAYQEFTTTLDFPLKSQHVEKIESLRSEGQVQLAQRLEKIYQSWAVSRAAGDLARRSEGYLPRPVEFTHAQFNRGFALARKGNRYFLLLRLFAKGHRYHAQKVLEEDFIDWRTREQIGGRKYPGLILPIEFGREYHDREFLECGKPQSAKLVVQRTETGSLEFFVNVAFEFAAEAVATETILGIDRGAAKIGSATVINTKGQVIAARLEAEGTAFSSEMARIRALIAERQRKGYRTGRQFKLRGRKADAIVGEYANRIIEIAKAHRSQIAVEKINAVSMSGFLTQSQFAKLKSSLTYKAERVGLPVPIEVPAAYTSQTCAKCVHTARENRPKRDSSGKSIQDIFRCVSCGYEANADDNASEVIALRALHQQLLGGKFQKFEVFKIWLTGMGRENSRSARA